MGNKGRSWWLMSESAHSRFPIKPRRVALAVICASACLIGLAPYLLFIDRLMWFGIIGPVVAVIAYIAVRKQETKVSVDPSWAEWALGAWSAVAMPATGSLGGLLFFGLFYWSTKLVVAAAVKFGLSIDVNPSTWGFWGSVWVVASMAIATPTQVATKLFQALYPPQAWGRTAFFPLLANRRRFVVIAALAAIGALIVMCSVLSWDGVAFPILLSLLIFYTSFPIAELWRKTTGATRIDVVKSLTQVFQHFGYRVIRAPRTGKPAIDPLLKSIDLMARGDDRAYAIEVRVVAGAGELEWNAATGVRTAATLLTSQSFVEVQSGGSVEPLLVVVGGKIAQSLQAYCQRESIIVVHFESARQTPKSTDELALQLRSVGVTLPSQPLIASTVS